MSEEEVKIIWVGHDFNGPINGIAEYKSEKLWFNRISEGEICTYDLYRIDNDTMESLQKNHEEYCKITGRPLLHGDAIRVIKNSGEDAGKILKVYKHMYENINMSGEYIKTITSDNIINFIVPRKLEYV